MTNGIFKYYAGCAERIVRDIMTLQMSAPLKVPAPTPPLKGTFPLDHDGQCRYEIYKYMLCMNEHKVCVGFRM